MLNKNCDLGIIGLGVMGRNFLLNLADHGHQVVGYDQDQTKVDALCNESGGKPVTAVSEMAELFNSLHRPHSVMLLVPAGPPVDSVIGELLCYLEPGDLVIDGGNSHFSDTDLRIEKLKKHDVAYLGVGISGGESGARHGPSIMPGGTRKAYWQISSLLEDAAAKVNDEPCVTYLGHGSAGHYVKMVHNGIEYGLMQLIAETYHLMKECLNMEDKAIGDTFADWNETELAGYLLEITAQIFHKTDPQTGRPLVELILDEARQKGTGMWASQDAMELQIPTPNIDVAVMMRHLSALKPLRDQTAQKLTGPDRSVHSYDMLLHSLHESLYAGMLLVFAQGMSQLYRASEKYHYNLNLEDVARVWRGGCIIRASLLEPIREALTKQPDLPNLLLDDSLCEMVRSRQGPLRNVVSAAVENGIPAAGFSAALVMRNRILRRRTKGVGRYTVKEAIDWGVTGPGLRACGLEWDFRKRRPYSGYDQFEFDIPTATHGDCYDRAVVRVEEMRQSMRIIQQCVDNMPEGEYKSDHPLATPPRKPRTMHDIETLITHFLSVSWGPVIPPGEVFYGIEATKGSNGYYLISDGGTMPYRVRIRTPSFPHIQMLRHISRGAMVPDLLAILGSIDFVLADVDR